MKEDNKSKIDFKDFKDFSTEDKEDIMPREKLLRDGAGSLKAWELLAILLRTGSKGLDVFELSKALFNYAGASLSNLANIEISDLKNIKGFGESKIATLIAAFEISNRVCQERAKENMLSLTSVDSASEYIVSKLQHLTEEHFMVLILNNKNMLINKSLALYNEDEMVFYDDSIKKSKNKTPKLTYLDEEFISKGTVNKTIAMPREVFRRAVKLGATSIIIAHNHPSGDSTPSREDVVLTERMVECGKILGIEVLDHIVVGHGDYFSLKQNGLM